MLSSIYRIFFQDNSLSPEDTINQGLFEMLSKRNHTYNALLLTDNGVFVTAAHCLYGDYNIQSGSVDSKGDFPRSRLILAHHSGDVGIGKLEMRGSSKPISYTFAEPQVGQKVTLLTKRGEIIQTPGVVDRLEPYFFGLEINARAGDSGGVIVNEDFGIVGLLSSVNAENHRAYATRSTAITGLINQIIYPT